MKDGFYRQTARVEGDHWWFRYRRRLVASVLARCGFSPAPGALALDIGCGTGGNLSALRGLGPLVIGLDRSAVALGLVRETAGAAPLVRADANRLEQLFEEASFELVSCFNVLYHRWIEDDRGVVRQVVRLLRPGGWFVLTEPAHRFLRRAHDRVDFGARRYSAGELHAIVRDSGLEIVRSTPFNAVAFPPAVVAAMIDRLRDTDPEREVGEETAELSLPPRPIGLALEALCGVEGALIGALGRVPFGVTHLIVARRPGGGGGG